MYLFQDRIITICINACVQKVIHAVYVTIKVDTVELVP